MQVCRIQVWGFVARRVVCDIHDVRLLVCMQTFNTALSWASRHARVKTVETLLDNNANLETKNTEVVVVVDNNGYKLSLRKRGVGF